MQTYQANSSEPAIKQISPLSGRLGKWAQYLQEPIDGASLAIFRICFGLAMIANLAKYYPTIEHDYITPRFNFSFIPGLHPWPGAGMYEHFAIMGSAALCLALGAWYRPAALVLFLGQTYLLLVEKSTYQNHFYLICLLALLFFLTPANRVWSFDNLAGKSPRTVPRWSLLIFKAQIFIVYFYGGVAKLNPDWLSGSSLSAFFHSMTPTSFYGLGQIFAQSWFPQLVVYGGIAIDFSIGILLWCPQTFWIGTLIALGFHLTNSILFPIGVFPWLMIATIGLFARPDWPRRVFQRFTGRSLALTVRGDGASTSAKPPVNDKEKGSATEGTAGGWESIAARWTAATTIVFLHVYLLVQVLVPLRHFLYPGDVAWTEQGHRFSWRMMLRGKDVKDFQITVTDPTKQKSFGVDLDKFLNRTQQLMMAKRPDMILQLAHFIADTYQAKTKVRPIVKVKAFESLNCRPAQYLIDPNVDLAAQSESLMPASWIVPLQPFTANSATPVDGASPHFDNQE